MSMFAREMITTTRAGLPTTPTNVFERSANKDGYETALLGLATNGGLQLLNRRRLFHEILLLNLLVHLWRWWGGGEGWR